MILYLIFKLSFSIRFTDLIPIDENDKWYIDSYKIPSIKAISNRLVIDTIYNLTYEHCEFNSLMYSGSGGAMFINTSSIFYTYCKLVECTFTNCSSRNGGALFITTNNNLTNVNMIFCLFDNNSCKSSYGGALYVEIATLIMQGCEFISNKINLYTSRNACGGAIYALKSPGYFENCSFLNNKISPIKRYIYIIREIKGGAVFCLLSTFVDCIFINNSICADNFSIDINLINGGAIYTEISNFTNCELNNNSLILNQPNNDYIHYVLNGGAVYSMLSVFNNCSLCNNSIFINMYSYSQSLSQIGGGAIFSNCSYFNNCTIKQNDIYLNTTLNNNQSKEAGGGVILCNYLFIEDCLINENNIFYQSQKGIKCGGGAIYTNNFLNAYNCTFNDNFIKSIYRIGFFYGGAIYSKLTAHLTNCFFNRNFVNGETYDCWSHLRGGAISLKYYNNIEKCSFCDNYIYMNSTIIQNFLYFANAYGGASDNYYITNFTDCSFTNNIIIAHGVITNIIGSAINYGGCLINCSFIDNHVIAHLDGTYDSYIQGGIIKGSINSILENCVFDNNYVNVTGGKPTFESGCITFYFENMINCSYIKNTVICNSASATIQGNLYICSRVGKAKIEDCKFINNTSHLFGRNSVIKGGGLFIDKNTEIKYCLFSNNSGNIYNDLSSIEGGIHFNYPEGKITLENCSFNNNNAYSSYEYKSKIICAIYFYLKSVELDICKFIDNNANYGYDFYLSSVEYFSFYFDNCEIIKHCSSNLYSKSIFYFTYEYVYSSGYYFRNNTVIIYNPNNNTLLFDGGTLNYKTNKWTFQDNCIHPYEENLYKNSSISFLDYKTSKEIKFNQAFSHACMIQTDIFTNSQYFSDSSIFTKSSYFSFSKEFSESNEFSRSNYFSYSNEFSRSNIFSYSNEFSRSNIFSYSNEFSRSNIFSYSNKFSKSNIFSYSNKFSKSNIFSYSNKFSKSNIFTHSNDFSQNIFDSNEFDSEHNSIFSDTLISQQTFITIKENESGTMIENSIQTRSNLMETESNYFDQVSDISSTNGGVSKTTIIGIVVGIIAAVAIITIASILIVKRRKNSKEAEFVDAEKETSFIKNTKSTLENNIDEDEQDLDFWL